MGDRSLGRAAQHRTPGEAGSIHRRLGVGLTKVNAAGSRGRLSWPITGELRSPYNISRGGIREFKNQSRTSNPSSAGEHMHGGRSIRSQGFSLIPLLRAMARVRTRNQTAADDLVEATLRLAVARRNQLQDGGNLTAWLLAIQRAIFASNSYDQSPPESELSRESGANWRTLHRALLQLPDTLREALFLSDGAGYEYEEIAEIVGTDVGTVKCRAGEAMCRLVELLEVHNDSVVPIHAYLPLRNASASNAELLHPTDCVRTTSTA
jgi:RNA polymerase sigma-70 factor, ECF subfamily